MGNFKHSILASLVLLSLSFHAIAQNGLQIINDSIYGDALSLRKMDIQAMDDGKVFIAYYDAGLSIYENGNLTFLNTENSTLPSNRVNDISIFNNKVYLATENGIATYEDGAINFPGGGLQGLQIESVIADGYNLYALCSSDDFVDSLAIFNGSVWQFKQFSGFTRSFLNNSPMLLHEGTLYFGCRNEGLFAYKSDEFQHIFHNVSVNDLTIYKDRLWISLNTLNPDGEAILIYNIDNQTSMKFSDHFAYEKIHGNKGSTFSHAEDGSLRIIYGFQTQLIVNTIGEGTHELMIYPDQSLNYTRYNSTDEVNGKIYLTAWSYLPGILIDVDLYQNFLSGFWSRNLKTLDINKVGATAKSYGSLFFDGNIYPRYQVPIDSNTNTIFASGIWIGGFDQSDNLHLSAVRYGENPGSGISLYDFAPGPLQRSGENQGVGDTLSSNKYDRIWKIDRYDIEQFNYTYKSKSFTIPDDMEDWPGNSDEQESLAPFVDQNNDGIYDLNDGDYPKIRGDQMLWWVMNDNTHPNEETGGLPLGVEMHHSLYGYRYDNPTDEYTELINYQTYLNVKVVNSSTEKYDSVYIGVWVDGDIGNPADDYIGCDVERNSFYFYNADDYDESFQDYYGYGYNPPVQTVTILNGPLADADGIDNDLDGIVDNERIKMSKFLYYNNINQGSNPAITDPFEAEDYYNYMTGHWKDGTHVCYGGNGHVSGGGNSDIPCNYMFPGETDPSGIGTNGIPQPAWSEETEDNNPDDRRGLCSIGPFTLEAGEETEVDILFAYIPNDGTRNGDFNYQPKLDSLITWFDENRIPNNYEDADALGIKDQKTAEVSVSPNPAKDYFEVRSNQFIKQVDILDINGRLIERKTMNDTHCRISSKALKQGVYLLRIETDKGITSRKLIIQ